MHIPFSRNEIIHEHNCYNGRNEAEIGAQKSEKILGGIDEEPGDDGPAEEVAENHSARDGEVLREETGEVAADGDGVAGDVGDDC